MKKIVYITIQLTITKRYINYKNINYKLFNLSSNIKIDF